MVKLYFDTEFSGLHQKTTLISIGLVAETGESFYAELTDYDKTQIDDWLKENVIANLKLTDKISEKCSSWENWNNSVTKTDTGIYINYNNTNENAPEFDLPIKDMKHYRMISDKILLKDRLTRWLSQFDKIEIWSDCLSYDWVLFNEIWGHAFKIPTNILYIPFDIYNIQRKRN